jgi:transposase
MAAKFLDDCCKQVMRSRIEPTKKAAKTMLAHRELILNYFGPKNSSPAASSRA